APRKQSRQAFAILDHLRAEIACVRVEQARLPDNRLDDPRMAVADMSDVVVDVQITPAVGIEEPDVPASYQMQGRIVEERQIAAHKPMPPLQQLLHRRPVRGRDRGSLSRRQAADAANSLRHHLAADPVQLVQYLEVA